MNEDELELRLLKGSPVKVDDLMIKPLTLAQIIDDIGYERYNNLLNVLGINLSLLKDISDEILDKLTTFDIFVADVDLMTNLIGFLRVFLQTEKVIYADKYQSLLIGDDSHLAVINRTNLDKVFDVFKRMYVVKFDQPEEYAPANEQAKAIIEKIRKKNEELAKVKSLSKSTINIASIISGVAFRSNNLTIQSVFNLTIYQLYEAYYRLQVFDNYDQTMAGIYAGTIDSKNINLKTVNWVKRSDF